jgi:hypothetical protein
MPKHGHSGLKQMRKENHGGDELQLGIRRQGDRYQLQGQRHAGNSAPGSASIGLRGMPLCARATIASAALS